VIVVGVIDATNTETDASLEARLVLMRYRPEGTFLVSQTNELEPLLETPS
jgi:hypothetical protein